jgi:hypothetical protein
VTTGDGYVTMWTNAELRTLFQPTDPALLSMCLPQFTIGQVDTIVWITNELENKQINYDDEFDYRVNTKFSLEDTEPQGLMVVLALTGCVTPCPDKAFPIILGAQPGCPDATFSASAASYDPNSVNMYYPLNNTPYPNKDVRVPQIIIQDDPDYILKIVNQYPY